MQFYYRKCSLKCEITSFYAVQYLFVCDVIKETEIFCSRKINLHTKHFHFVGDGTQYELLFNQINLTIIYKYCPIKMSKHCYKSGKNKNAAL